MTPTKLDDDAEINPVEIKIENDKIKNMFEKYKKNSVKFRFEGLLFSSAIKNETGKIFVTVGGLMDAKYSLIKEKLYQRNKKILAVDKHKPPGAGG